MRRLLKWILNILALVFGLLLAGAYISRVISPGDFWPISFLGLIFPFLLIINIIILILLIIIRSKFSLLVIGLLVIGWNPIRESFQVLNKNRSTDTSTIVRVMSYNVQVFDYFQRSGRENRGKMLLDFVAKEKPDIICFQEFLSQNRGDYDIESIGEQLSFAPFKHTKYSYEGRTYKVGLAIFSRYPIVNTGVDHFPVSERRYIYADVRINEDTVRIFNIHLESNRLNQKQINLIDSLISSKPKDKKNEYLGIVKNMKSAYIERARQADQINKEVASSPHPVIAAGDFNDTPVSYSYRRISSDLQDAFVSSGRGMGATYHEFMFPLRIDFLLHHPELSSSAFVRHEIDFSDHRPIEASFWLDTSKRK